MIPSETENRGEQRPLRAEFAGPEPLPSPRPVATKRKIPLDPPLSKGDFNMMTEGLCSKCSSLRPFAMAPLICIPIGKVGISQADGLVGQPGPGFRPRIDNQY